MSETDLRLRDSAVPFIAWHQNETNSVVDPLIIYTCPLIANSNTIEAYAAMFLPVNSSLTAKIAIGEFDTNGVDPILDYSQAYIDASHKKLTGLDNAIASANGLLILDGINLLKERQKFNQHGFVLLLQFSRQLDEQTEYADLADKLQVHCSAEMGLL